MMSVFAADTGTAAMNPVLILQFMDTDAPAYLGTWLASARHCMRASTGHSPTDFRTIDGYSALALLGGSMSANDDLPFLRTAQA